MDMSHPTSRSGITCLVPAPRRVTSWLLPFKPFQMALWLGIVGCLVIETLGLFLTRKLGKEMVIEQSWKNSFKFAFISTLKIFISQSTNYEVNSISVRVILFSCYMIDIIITSVYSGGLASILTIPSWEEAADTIDRLVKQKLEWAATSLAWVVALKSTQEEKITKLLDLFRIYNGKELQIKSLTERIGIALERLQFGHFAIPDYIEQAAVNRMKIMTEDLSFEHIVAFAPRAWSFMEKFNNACHMVQSSGLLKYWEWKIVAKYLDEKMQKQIETSAYTDFDAIGPVELSIDNFAGISVIWISGTMLSVLTFMGEVFFHRCIFKNTQNKVLRH